MFAAVCCAMLIKQVPVPVVKYMSNCVVLVPLVDLSVTCRGPVALLKKIVMTVPPGAG